MTSRLAPPTTDRRDQCIKTLSLSIVPKRTLENRQVLIRLVQTTCAWLHVQQVDMCEHTPSLSHTHTHTKAAQKWCICSFVKIFAALTLNPLSEVQSLYKSDFPMELYLLLQSKFIGPRGT